MILNLREGLGSLQNSFVSVASKLAMENAANQASGHDSGDFVGGVGIDSRSTGKNPNHPTAGMRVPKHVLFSAAVILESRPVEIVLFAGRKPKVLNRIVALVAVLMVNLEALRHRAVVLHPDADVGFEAWHIRQPPVLRVAA